MLQCKTCFCDLNDVRDKLVNLLKNRGPDSQNTVKFQDEKNGMNFYMHASLLWLRGSKPHIQPAKENENFLLWNGDLFNTNLPDNLSDTEYISNKLSNAKDEKSVQQVFAQLYGPGAYLYYKKSLDTIFFGRDIFGRHSLLASVRSCHFILSSIGFKGSDLTEVPALGIYELTLGGGTQIPNIKLVTWANRTPVETEIKLPFGAYVSLDETLTPSVDTVLNNRIIKDLQDYENLEKYLSCDMAKKAVDGLRNVLEISVAERVQAQPLFCKDCIKNKFSSQFEKRSCLHSKVAVLFSGGLDSTVLVYLAALSVNQGEKIDLLNVAFQQVGGLFNPILYG